METEYGKALEKTIDYFGSTIDIHVYEVLNLRLNRISGYNILLKPLTLIELRNKYQAIPVVVSQFNRELGDIQRQRFKELVPQLEDFKDSGNSQEDANVVIALFSPKRYNIDRYLEYDLKFKGVSIGDYFRALFIIKNRGGRDGVSLATRFLGECGYFEELPNPDEFERNPEYYKAITDFSIPFNEITEQIKDKTYKLKK